MIRKPLQNELYLYLEVLLYTNMFDNYSNFVLFNKININCVILKNPCYILDLIFRKAKETFFSFDNVTSRQNKYF